MNRLLVIAFLAMATLVCLGSSSPSPIRQSIFTVSKYGTCYKKYNVQKCMIKEMKGKDVFTIDVTPILAKCKESAKEAIRECKKLYGQN